MRIKKLELKNFRGFEELTMDFPEGESGLAVLVGVNGSGKTSVLDAIKSLVFTITAQAIINNARKLFDFKKASMIPSLTNSRRDLKRETEESSNHLVFEYLDIQWNTQNMILDGLVGTSCYPPLNTEEILLAEDEYEAFNQNSWTAGKVTELVKQVQKRPPCFISYVSDRSVQDNPSLEAKDIMNINPLETAEEGFLEIIDFEEFFEWFRNTEDYKNERIRHGDDFSYRNKHLESVRKAIAVFLPDYKKIRVQRQPYEEFIIEKAEIKLSNSNLSKGERMILTMVGNIARRLCISYPDSDSPLEGEGVVLIDEIEQHLHPGWQRSIIPNLRRTFPNIQFILTTHSPEVLSNVPKENVFVLEDFKLLKNTPHTLGKDSNAILWDIFGVEKRPPLSKEEFSKLYRTMDDPDKVKETENLLREAEEKYGYYDEVVVRARGHFQFLNED